jgi:hypothetical protein
MATENKPPREYARVAAVLDRFQVVLNKGARDGVQMGESFIIYAIGPDIEDPITGENIGPLELVKGRGKVIHLQEKLSTIRSSVTKPIYSQNPWIGLNLPQTMRHEEQPFGDVKVGDFARPI